MRGAGSVGRRLRARVVRDWRPETVDRAKDVLVREQPRVRQQDRRRTRLRLCDRGQPLLLGLRNFVQVVRVDGVRIGDDILEMSQLLVG